MTVLHWGVGFGGDDGRCDGSDFVHERLAVDDGVESVVRVSGVLDGALVSIGVDQGVGSGDDVPVASLVLALRVPGEAVLHVVGERVLRVVVVVLLLVRDLGVDGLHGFGVHRLLLVGDWLGIGHRRRGVGRALRDVARVRDGGESAEGQELLGDKYNTVNFN